MPRNGSGVYSAPSATLPNPADLGDADKIRSALTDLGTEITGSLPVNGSTGMTADLPMGGNQITNVGAPSASTDAATKGYADTLDAAQTAALTAGLATKANSSHTQAASTISDSTTVGRAVLTATDAAAARTAIGATQANILPSQTGNSGKLLTTDGTNASWVAPQPRILAGGYFKGNVAGSAQLQSGSSNIASVTRSGTGQYDIVFATNAPDVNYWIMTNCSYALALSGQPAFSNKTVSGFRVNFAGYQSGAFATNDCDVHIVCFSTT